MKYIFTLWPGPQQPASRDSALLQARREQLIDFCFSQLKPQQPQALSLYLTDEFSQSKSPAPKWYAGDELLAHIEFTGGLLSSDVLTQLNQALLELGYTSACYEVEASLYRDYGDNAHFRRRDWQDGERSPAVIAVTLLTKPKRLDLASWTRRWWGGMSPVSERLQPRARYQRNLIVDKHYGGLSFNGLVTESWPSTKHISNPYLFYNASNPLQLVSHLAQMLAVITRFHQLHKIRTVIMSEYFLLSPVKST